MNVVSRFSRLLSLMLAISVVAIGMIAAAACGDDDDDDDVNGGQTTEATPMAKVGDLKIYDGWARTTTNNVSAAYFTVKNSGLEDTLVKATSNITTTVQLHEVITEGASSKMQEKAGGFPVPAKGEVVLKPGGYHVMLMDLKAPLKEGDSVELELEFAKAGKVKLTVPVKPAAESGMEGMSGATPGSGMSGGGMGMATATAGSH